jgi:hypothetical protein
MGRELCLPKAGVPLGTSCRDFPIHAESLGLHRTHAQHRACGPGSPRQRAPSPRPSGPPQREGAPKLPPQAWGALRQRGGSESLARATRSAGLQPSHTTGAIPDPVPDPRLLSQNTRWKRDRNCGSRTTVWPANWVERTMTTSSSATSPVPLRHRSRLVRAPASGADFQLGRPSPSFRRQFPGHVRTPREFL